MQNFFKRARSDSTSFAEQDGVNEISTTVDLFMEKGPRRIAVA
jgi:hypothetical protein